jgi:hypothetical protein
MPGAAQVNTGNNDTPGMTARAAAVRKCVVGNLNAFSRALTAIERRHHFIVPGPGIG